jgi:energy-coupling factor transporter ATP-binding protein EcfA2
MDAVSRAFLIGAMRPIGPYPFLAVEGEQGSGKSTACEMTKRIIDPTTTLRASLPETVENLLVMASHRHLSVFDNVSGMRGEISDGLAKLATGGGYEKRKLYSDGDLFSIDICRPFALNGIGDFIHRADLMDRGIVLRLEAPPPGKRKTEAAMIKEFEALLPELLHDLWKLGSLLLGSSGGPPIPDTPTSSATAAGLLGPRGRWTTPWSPTGTRSRNSAS